MNKSTIPAEASIVTACRSLYTAVDELDAGIARRLGVLRSDLRCLNMLEQRPVTPTQIAQALGLTSGSVTALIDRLEAKGVVERVRDTKDRRSLPIKGTPLLFAELGPIYKTVAIELSQAVAAYPPREQALAVRHLEDVARACQSALRKLGDEPGQVG